MTRRMEESEWYVEFTVCAWCGNRFYGDRRTCSETCRLNLKTKELDEFWGEIKEGEIKEETNEDE